MRRFCISVLLVALVAYAAHLAFNPFNQSYLDQGVAIEVSEQEQVGTIADSLWERGAFKNRYAFHLFKLVASVVPPESRIAYESTGSRPNFALALLADVVEPPLAYVRIFEGKRIAEVAQQLQDSLGWTADEAALFVGPSNSCSTDPIEGYLYPATYAIAKDSNPLEVRKAIIETFEEKLATVIEEASKSQNVASTVNIIDEATAVKIASLIQRETGGVSDMRLISGIIWNRLFADMSLDIDATLQYAKASTESIDDEDAVWWPRVLSKDKYIDSPYNTYQNKGLPPTPIATPSNAALVAAVNPLETECLFYLHDAKKRIHCAKTYEQHKKNINTYLK